MSQTFHDMIREALIKEAIENGQYVDIFDHCYFTPEKYRRMWKKITGKIITLEKAKQALEGK